MLLNRRAMLSAGIGAMALSLSGCNHTRTTVIFVNNYSVPLTIAATADGKTFSKKNVQPGHSVQQLYLSNETLGTDAALTGTVTAAGQVPIDLAGFGLFVKVGYKNTIAIDSFGAVTLAVQ